MQTNVTSAVLHCLLRLGFVRPAPLLLNQDRVTVSFQMRKQRSEWRGGVPQLERGQGHFI